MGILLILIVLAFAASILSAIPKLLFFLRVRGTYEIILNYSLIGTFIGSVIAFIYYLHTRVSLIDEPEGEMLLVIPVFFMLLGIIVGSIKAYRFSSFIPNNIKRNIIRKEIDWRGMKIQLLEIEDRFDVPYESISNLRAVDKENNIIWQSEPLKTHHDHFYDMSLDEKKNILIGYSDISYHYEISLVDGKILNYRLVK